MPITHPAIPTPTMASQITVWITFFIVSSAAAQRRPGLAAGAARSRRLIFRCTFLAGAHHSPSADRCNSSIRACPAPRQGWCMSWPPAERRVCRGYSSDRGLSVLGATACARRAKPRSAESQLVARPGLRPGDDRGERRAGNHAQRISRENGLHDPLPEPPSQRRRSPSGIWRRVRREARGRSSRHSQHRLCPRDRGRCLPAAPRVSPPAYGQRSASTNTG